MDTAKRVVCWFSCGAASAYATYLAKQKYGEVSIVYCKVVEEHPDSLRFLQEYEKFIGQKVEIIGDESKDFSIYKVFESRGFIKGPEGAPCTMILKKWQRKKYQRIDDIQVFGYTAEETKRIDSFIDGNNDVNAEFPLADNGINKQDCLNWLVHNGVALPKMYQLGYSNNNCVGCVKGGMGYWNAIRQDFPDVFEKMAKLERHLGHAINKDKDGPVFLDVLEIDRGNFKRDQPPACGFTCEWQQQEMW